MKRSHRVPARPMTSEPITPEYQAQVDRSTAKIEREHAAAQRRLDGAQRRAERLQQRAASRPVKAHDLAVAWEMVELRRQELAEVERLMWAAGAGAQHRGRKSYRTVPITHRSIA